MYSNKVVLVTGTSRGVGFELAKYFLKNNAIVIGFSRGISSVKNTNYNHFSVDLSNPYDISKTFKLLSKQFKNIDILINNAAVLTSQYSLIMPIKNAVDMVNINLLGTFFVSRESAKLMKKSFYGRIINISSMAVLLKPAGDSIYAASKAGIQTLANIMAKEYSSMNITCNSIAISAIETEMLKQHSPSAQLKIKKIIQNLPIPRMANFDDIFNVVDFYCSERSSYISGQTIYLGGLN